MQSYMKDEPLARESDAQFRSNFSRSQRAVYLNALPLILSMPRRKHQRSVSVSGVKVDQADTFIFNYCVCGGTVRLRFVHPDDDGGSCGLSSSKSEETSSRLIF